MNFSLPVCAIFSKKLQNTVLDYKKGSKAKSEKSDRSTNPILYIVSLYDFAYKSVWIDLKENLDFSLQYRFILFLVKNDKIPFLVAKRG